MEEGVEEGDEAVVEEVPEFVLSSRIKDIAKMGATVNISMAVLGRATQARATRAHLLEESAVQRGMYRIAIASSNSSRIHIKVFWLM